MEKTIKFHHHFFPYSILAVVSSTDYSSQKS